MFIRRLEHALLVTCLVAVGTVAFAARTDPDLALYEVRAFDGAGTAIVRFEGLVLGEDLRQYVLPLQLLVYGDDGTYVRFDVSGEVRSGQEPLLAAGATITATVAQGLLASGTLVPTARVLSIRPGAIAAALPTSFPAASASRAVLFLEHQGEILISNTVPVTLEVSP